MTSEQRKRAVVQPYTLPKHNKKAFRVLTETQDGVRIKKFNPTSPPYVFMAQPKQAAEDAAYTYAAEINQAGPDMFYDRTKLAYGIELYKQARKNQEATSYPRSLSADERSMGETNCDIHIAKTSLINMAVLDIDEKVLQVFIKELLSKGTYSNDKIGRLIATLKQVLDACVNPPLMPQKQNNGKVVMKKVPNIIDNNKLRGLKAWKKGKREIKPVEIPQKKDMQQIIDAATGVYGIMFLAISLTGMRWQEAAGLMWSRIGWNSRQITIDHAIVRISKVATLVDQTKTDAGQRLIPIPGQLLEALKQWKKDSKSDDKFVFGRDGSFIPHGTVLRYFNKIKDNLGLTFKGGIHSLRHYYASLLFEWHSKKIISLIELQEMIGHEDWAFTAKVYAKAFNDEEHKFKQLDKIDQFLQN